MDTDQPSLPGVEVTRVTVTSPSALGRYRHCPRLYRFLNVDGLWQYSRSSPEQSFGTAVHAALRDFHRTPPARRGLELLLDAFRAAWTREGGNKGERERGLTALRGWYERADTGLVPVATELGLSGTWGEITLKGRIDRVDRVPGGLRVVDYKTSRRPISQERADTDLALTVYAALVAKRLGEPVEALVLDYVVAGATVTTTRPPAMFEQRLAEVLDTAVTLRNDTQYRPNTGPWCARCDLLGRCPAGQDRVAADAAHAEAEATAGTSTGGT
jgi:RecB family exonuclease